MIFGERAKVGGFTLSSKLCMLVPLQEQYTLSRCKAPLPCGLMRKMGIPLPAEQVEVLHTGLDWEEFKVGSVWSSEVAPTHGVQQKAALFVL